MKNVFYIESGKVTANIEYSPAGEHSAHVVANNLAMSLVATDFESHEDLYKFLMNTWPVLQTHFKVSGTAPAGKFEATIEKGFITSHNLSNSDKSEGGVMGLIGRTVEVQIAKINPDLQKVEDYREYMHLDFAELEIRVIAQCHVGLRKIHAMHDAMYRALANVIQMAPKNIQTLCLVEETLHSVLRNFCAEFNWSLDWFKIEIPELQALREQAAKEAAIAAEAAAQAKDERRVQRVRGQVTRAVRAVRQSHSDTLTCVMGDTEAADAVLNEVEAHLQVYYGKAVNTKFHEVREHAIKCVDGYVAEKIEALQANQTVVNNININIDKDADAELIQEQVNNISRTVLTVNGAMQQCEAVTHKIDFNLHTHKVTEESPCLQGLKGADRVQWLIDNVPAGYLSANLEMYVDFEDIKDWMLRVYHTKETIGQAFERLYGYNPIETNWVPAEQHYREVNDLKEQVDKLTGAIIKRDETIANQINVIDKQNQNITSLSGANNYATDMIRKIKNVMDGQA